MATRPSATLAALALALATPALLGAGAAAPERVHGTVTAVDASKRLVYVHHDPFGDMPSMTMPFAVDAATLRRLHRGDTVSGTLGPSKHCVPALHVTAIVAPPAAAAPAAFVPVLHQGDLVPATPLVDEAGHPFSLRDLHGRTAIVAFIFTRCRDPRMCPLVTLKFERLQRTVDPARTHLVELTLDPAYDTPAVLARYGRAVGADPQRWTFATGSPANAGEVAARLGIDARSDPSAILVHGEAAVIVGADGRIADVIDGNDWTPEELQAKISALAQGRANPLLLVALALARNVGAMCGGGAGLPGWAWLAVFGAAAAAFGTAAYRVLRGIFA